MVRHEAVAELTDEQQIRFLANLTRTFVLNKSVLDAWTRIFPLHGGFSHLRDIDDVTLPTTESVLLMSPSMDGRHAEHLRDAIIGSTPQSVGFAVAPPSGGGNGEIATTTSRRKVL